MAEKTLTGEQAKLTVSILVHYAEMMRQKIAEEERRLEYQNKRGEPLAALDKKALELDWDTAIRRTEELLAVFRARLSETEKLLEAIKN